MSDLRGQLSVGLFSSKVHLLSVVFSYDPDHRPLQVIEISEAARTDHHDYEEDAVVAHMHEDTRCQRGLLRPPTLAAKTKARRGWGTRSRLLPDL